MESPHPSLAHASRVLRSAQVCCSPAPEPSPVPLSRPSLVDASSSSAHGPCLQIPAPGARFLQPVPEPCMHPVPESCAPLRSAALLCRVRIPPWPMPPESCARHRLAASPVQSPLLCPSPECRLSMHRPHPPMAHASIFLRRAHDSCSPLQSLAPGAGVLCPSPEWRSSMQSPHRSLAHASRVLRSAEA